MISKWIKKLLQKTGYTFIKTSFLKSYYHSLSDPYYRRTADLDPLEQLFYKYLPDDFFFVQIGANNGQRYDPIHHLVVKEKIHVKGIAIEPATEYFNELAATYKDFPQIKLVKKAIHNFKTEETMYKIDP